MIKDRNKKRITRQIVFAFSVCVVMTAVMAYAFMRRGLDSFGSVGIINISADVVTAFFATILFASGLFDDYDIYTEEFIILSRLMFFEVCALFFDGMSMLLQGIPRYFALCNVLRAFDYSYTAVLLTLIYKLIRTILGLEGRLYDRVELVCVIISAAAAAANFLDLRFHFLFLTDPVSCTYTELPAYGWVAAPFLFIIGVNIFFSLRSDKKGERKTAVCIMAFIPFIEMFTFLLDGDLDILFPLFFIGVLTAFVCIYSGRKAELELKNSDIEFAANVQKHLLPRSAVIGRDRPYEIFGMTESAENVSGDFYDYYETGADSVCFSVGDVCGEGIPSALFMMETSSAVRNYALSGCSCDEVFNRANELLNEHNELGFFAMCWHGCLDLRTGAVCFSNAGHRPPVIIRKGGRAETLSFRPDIPVAALPGTRFVRNEFALSPGDILLLYTDGIVEATDRERRMFGVSGLISAAERDTEDLEALCGNVMSAAREFSYDLSREEDMTLLALRYNGFGGDDR